MGSGGIGRDRRLSSFLRYCIFYYFDLFSITFYSLLGSSLNVVVVFNLDDTTAARFALKTTAAFNEETKKMENDTKTTTIVSTTLLVK